MLIPHHWAKSALLTIHPSFLLPIAEPDQKQEEYQRFAEDLRKVRAVL
jgi:hypothetical protein